jgi:putative transposase
VANPSIRLERKLEIAQDPGPVKAILQFLVLVARCSPALIRSRSDQAIVELTLRQQLAVYAAKKPRPRLTPLDRGFWVAMFQFWPRWRSTLVIVKPSTVIGWHRKGFRLYWRWISSSPPGRPRVSKELQALIRRFTLENGWGARKILAELQKLGFTISLATVSRYLPKKLPDLSKQQRWMTFLHNHRQDIAAMDFFVVPTIRFRLLYVWFLMGHDRRKIVHFGVTANPTAPWVVQRLRDAYLYDSAPKFDNDSIFSNKVTDAISDLGIEPKRTAFRSPWQNGTAERWVGSCKRELIDHVIVMDEGHLRRLVRDYVDYYNSERVHTVLRDAPNGRPVEIRPSDDSKVVGLPRVGGLHHRYVWKTAA